MLFSQNKFTVFGATTKALAAASTAPVHSIARLGAAAAGSGGEAATASFRDGAYVEILGLRNKPELNGCKAMICGAIDSASGRWTVQVLSSGEFLKLKPENLKLSSPIDAAGVVSGRTADGGFSEKMGDIAGSYLDQFVKTQSIARLAELAFDPSGAVATTLWGKARFADGSPEVEREVFLRKLEEIANEHKRTTSLFVCDVSFVREALKRIYAGARSMSEILPRKSMCPLDVPLLEKVLIAIKMFDFIHTHRPQWVPLKPVIFQGAFGNANFAKRCALLAFPSLARFPGGRNAPGTVDQERASVREKMSDPRAQEFLGLLWDAAENLRDPVRVAFLARKIQDFDHSEANDAVICLCALEYAASIAQRGATEYVSNFMRHAVFESAVMFFFPQSHDGHACCRRTSRERISSACA